MLTARVTRPGGGEGSRLPPCVLFKDNFNHEASTSSKPVPSIAQKRSTSFTVKPPERG